jgi:sugar O-acyltransferase (sialic acid O-acetyltransferase NeuD family)
MILDGNTELAGFLDDDTALHGLTIGGLPTLGSIASWRDRGIDRLVPAIGTNRARRGVFIRELERGAIFATVIHPSAIISRSATIGPGTAVLAGAVVNADAVIGDDVIINTGAIVEHDCQIAPHVHLAPSCCLAGNVSIGEGTFLGMGSRVLPGIKIGSWCIIGAGAVVTKDIDNNRTCAGIPARILK